MAPSAAARELTPSTSARSYSPAFYRALATLDTHGVGPDHAGAALALWWDLAAWCAPREPLVQVTGEGAVQFAWNRDRDYLDVEVHRDGRFAWYFHDRVAGPSEGTEDEPEATLPAAFWAHLRVAAAS